MKNDFVDHYLSEYMNEKNAISSSLFKEGSQLFTAENLQEFTWMGRELYMRGLATSHGGNMSITDGKYIWITRAGASLANLQPSDVVMATWNPDEDPTKVSTEATAHHAIYRGAATYAKNIGMSYGNMAIIHALSPYVLFRSMVDDEIYSVDGESNYVLGESTPVVKIPGEPVAREAAKIFEEVAAEGVQIFAVRRHGAFAIAPTLERAQRLVTCLEQTSKILTMFEQTGRKFNPSDFAK